MLEAWPEQEPCGGIIAVIEDYDSSWEKVLTVQGLTWG